MSTIDTIEAAKAARASAAPVRSHALALLPDLARRIGFAIERWRQRRDLLELTDRELRDIGLTRRQARHEAARPFWD